MARQLLVYPDVHLSLKRLEKTYRRTWQPSPSDADLDDGDAYLLVAHSVIEFWFEELCRRAVYASLRRYALNSVASGPLVSIMQAYYWAKVNTLPRSGFEPHVGDALVERSVKWYIDRVDDNNGIKRSNLLAILLPLGLDAAKIDDIWLDSMDSFGGQRGDVAHGRPRAAFGRSPVTLQSAGATRQIAVWSSKTRRLRAASPTWDVTRTINALLPGIIDVDQQVASIVRRR